MVYYGMVWMGGDDDDDDIGTGIYMLTGHIDELYSIHGYSVHKR
jgi:hypothetical protein